ncbi:MAG: hypothetical protein OXF30_00240 [Candidatus Saccharibacteria bacterium]|nr:hypothetical protein [Candidatus Saccharibacteria bacterium]
MNKYNKQTFWEAVREWMLGLYAFVWFVITGYFWVTKDYTTIHGVGRSSSLAIIVVGLFIYLGGLRNLVKRKAKNNVLVLFICDLLFITLLGLWSLFAINVFWSGVRDIL